MNEARYREAERRLWASLDVTPSERRLELPRCGVSVRVQEMGTGPVVVFVHGSSNSGASWAPLVARLDDFRCIVLDRPGCGLSEPLQSRFAGVEEIETFAESLIVDVLDALELDGAHVVSTSFGGYLAIRSAAVHPDRITRLVEIGWTVGAPIDRMPLVMRAALIPAVGRLMTTVPPTRGAVRAMLRQIGLRQAMKAGRVSDELIDWFLAVMRDTDTMRNELNAFSRVDHPMRAMDDLLHPTSLLERIRIPVRFIWGEEDLFGGADIAEAFVAQFLSAELDVIPGAGHAPWLDDSARVAEITRASLCG